jgi:hypothetical protein
MDRRILLAPAAVGACLAILAGCASGGSGDASGSADAETDVSTSADTSLPREGGRVDAQVVDSGRPSTDASSPDANLDGLAEVSPPDSGALADGSTIAVDAVAPDGSAWDAMADSASPDASTPDARVPDASDAASVGVITGGPCVSGAAGATAVRIEWIDANGNADVQWVVEGDPDTSNDFAGAYGYQIGFTPSYVDQFLAQGGVGLDDSDFVDISLSTAGITSIASATLSIYGRSYDVSSNGSFNWQTFDGTGQTPTDFVSNVPPYQWYSADMTTEIGPGETNVLVRIKAGPSSDALVVNQIEICLVAD